MSIEDEERADREDRTIFISGISEKVTEKLLHELMFQAGKYLFNFITPQYINKSTDYCLLF